MRDERWRGIYKLPSLLYNVHKNAYSSKIKEGASQQHLELACAVTD
jgi:hypothetical protein